MRKLLSTSVALSVTVYSLIGLTDAAEHELVYPEILSRIDAIQSCDEGQFGNWTVCSPSADGNTCLAWTTPITVSATRQSHPNRVVTVDRWSFHGLVLVRNASKETANTLVYVGGFPKKAATVSFADLQTDIPFNDKVAFITSNHKHWALLASHLQFAEHIEFSAASIRGTNVTDVFSLAGFAEVSSLIEQRCP